MARILDNDLLGDEEYVERTLRPHRKHRVADF